MNDQVPFEWSENAAHIRTLYRRWQPGDGYAEKVIAEAESSLGVSLPATLRAFYRDWGARDDLTQVRDTLLAPHEIFLRSGALIFCGENQSVLYWAIMRESLGGIILLCMSRRFRGTALVMIQILELGRRAMYAFRTFSMHSLIGTRSTAEHSMAVGRGSMLTTGGQRYLNRTASELRSDLFALA